MNTELLTQVAEAIYPSDFEKREALLTDLKVGRFKEFGEDTMKSTVDFFVEHGEFPKLFCQDVQHALVNEDRDNCKVFAHVCTCQDCLTKATERK